MTNLNELRSGDTVRNLGSGEAYVVTYTDGKTVIGVRTITITNPQEWQLVTISETSEEIYNEPSF